MPTAPRQPRRRASPRGAGRGRRVAEPPVQLPRRGARPALRLGRGRPRRQRGPEPERDPELYHHPSTRPGDHLPHAWLQHGTARVSTLDLTGHGRFALLDGIGGQAWADAAAKVAADLGVELAVRRVGHRQEHDDVCGDWDRLRGVGDGGALLVRPDQHVAWRAADLPGDIGQALGAAVRRVLALDPEPQESR